MVSFYSISNSRLNFLFKDRNNVGQIEIPSIWNIDSSEEYDYVPRSTSFLRFGRQLPSSSSSFLHFGRSPLKFLRFGRSNQNREAFFRFGKKGEFLRFG